jgi:hypothetical protein
MVQKYLKNRAYQGIITYKHGFDVYLVLFEVRVYRP